MRTDLKFTYDDLDSASERLRGYQDTLGMMENSLANLKSFLENQKSDSTEALLAKIGAAETDIEGKKNTSMDVSGVVAEYVQAMSELVQAKNTAAQTRVDYIDISYNIGQIESDARILSALIDRKIPSSFIIDWFEDEYKKADENAKRVRNYNKLDGVRIGTLQSYMHEINQSIQRIRDIYNNNIRPLETVDDNYRKRLDAVYDLHTSGQDKWGDFWKHAFSIGGAFVKAFAGAFVITVACVLAPTWLLVGVAAVLIVGGAILAATPEENVPNWLKGAKETSDSFKDELVKLVTEGPGAVVEDIGQGLMDTVQTPEGIASVAGEVAGLLVGRWAGAKIKAKMSGGGSEQEIEKPVAEKESPTAEEINEAAGTVESETLEQGNAPLKELSKPSSKALRKNMVEAGVPEPDYPHAAHHIVAGTAPKAEEAREILRSFGVDINDFENGVFLPTEKGFMGAYHPSLHTDSYYRKVTEALRSATCKEDVIDILTDIAEQLMQGSF